MSLELLWTCANTPEPSLDRRDLSPETLNQWLAAGLLREDAPSYGVSCESCVEANWLEVFVDRDAPGAPSRFSAYCPDHGRIAIEPSALMRYRVDFRPVVHCLAAGMEMKSAPEEILPGRVWRLGQRRLDDRPFYFSIVLGADWTGGHALPAEAMPRHGVVFLVGSERGDSLSADVTLVAMRDVMGWRDGRLELDVAACRRAATGVVTERTSHRKATPTRGARLQVTAKLKDYVIQHIRDQKRLQRHSEAEGFDWRYEPLPPQQEIARLLEVTPSRLSRAINDKSDPLVAFLLDMAKDDQCVYHFDVEGYARRKSATR